MKWYSCLGVGVLAVVVLMTVAFLSGRAYFVRRVESEIAQIKAKGEPLTFEDLYKESIPDSENAAPVYMQIFNALSDPAYAPDVNSLNYFGSASGGPDWEGARESIGRLGNVYALMEEAARRPRCRFPAQNTHPLNVNEDILAHMRCIQRLIHTSAVVNARNGNMEEAVRSADLALRTAGASGEQYSMIGLLAQSACMSIASKTLREVAQHGHISEAQAKRLYDTLSGIDLNASYKRALTGERIMRLNPELLIPGGMPSAATPLLLPDKAVYLRVVRELLDASDRPYREHLQQGSIPDETNIPGYAQLTMISLPIYHKALIKRDAAIAQVDGCKAFVAVLAFKDRFGKYPADLQEVRGKLRWQAPEDPFSGKDLVYRRQNGGFILYSIGENMTDDSGSDHQNADIVWRMDR